MDGTHRFLEAVPMQLVATMHSVHEAAVALCRSAVLALAALCKDRESLAEYSHARARR